MLFVMEMKLLFSGLVIAVHFEEIILCPTKATI